MDAPYWDSGNWPRIVQLSWRVTDEHANLISEKSYIIRPDDFFIPAEVSKIHGITNDIARQRGTPIMTVLEDFNRICKRATYLVAHNFMFDRGVIDAEFFRHGWPTPISSQPAYCTMMNAKDYCKLDGYYDDYKYPKLQELHYILFGEYFENGHDASADVRATERCFWELRRRGAI